MSNKRQLKWAAVVVALIAAAYGAYVYHYPTYSYRYRITIEVATASGVKTGSSVLQAVTSTYPAWITLNANDHATAVTGEAVFVDLGEGRNVIALLALGPHAQDGRISFFAPRSFLTISEKSPRDVEWSRQLSRLSNGRGRRPFAGDLRPTLVTFKDLRDPATMQEVPFDDPQSVLGPEVRSVSSWIEITRDHETNILETKLPWIRQVEALRTAWRIVTGGRPGPTSPRGLFKH